MESLDLLTNDLQVSSSVKNYLNESAKWGRFLAIIGFIFCGLIAIAVFFIPAIYRMLPAFNELPSVTAGSVATGITIVYLFLAIILFFPSLYLYKFSVKMHTALNSLSQDNFEESVKSLKSMLKFYGVFIIVILSFYVIVFLIGMLGLAVRG